MKAATLTGSEPAGRAVASTAGEMIKKTVLELGGSDPYVVMPSADLDRAAEVAVTARTQNAGQSCIAAKRFIVHTDVYDAFAERFVAGMKALKVGDRWTRRPTSARSPANGAGTTWRNWSTTPSARAPTVLCGGERPDGPGWFYPPTVLAGIGREMRIHREEAFGPVATLYRAADVDEAVLIANDTDFGLSSNVWTRDEAEVDRFVRDLEAGSVYVNGMTASHPAFPFGGVKRSGYGRELSGHGIREFCNITTVWQGA
ncbi:hypothetical protein GCM10023238_23420 [Streptomyces heliomycini]